MKHNIRHIVLLSVALALVGALVLSSAVLARGPEGAGTTPNQLVSQQQVQAQNQVQVQQQEQVQTAGSAQAQNQVQVQQQEQVQNQAQAQNQVQVQQEQAQNQAQAQNQVQVQKQAQAQNQLQVQSTAGPRQQHVCSDCDNSQAQEGRACQNGNIYGPGYGTGPIGCGLFGPGPNEKCLDQDGICDCREWKGGFR